MIKATISRLIRDEVRETDIVGKMSKGTLCMILHKADIQESYRVAERIKEKVQAYFFSEKNHKNEIYRTISIGAACFPTHAQDKNQLAEMANQMLKKSIMKSGNTISIPTMRHT